MNNRMINVRMNASAAARPNCACWNAVRKRSSVTVRVVSRGPPPVRTKIVSNDLSAPMLAIVKTKNVVGDRRGSVILVKIWRWLVGS